MRGIGHALSKLHSTPERLAMTEFERVSPPFAPRLLIFWVPRPTELWKELGREPLKVLTRRVHRVPRQRPDLGRGSSGTLKEGQEVKLDVLPALRGSEEQEVIQVPRRLTITRCSLVGN